MGSGAVVRSDGVLTADDMDTWRRYHLSTHVGDSTECMEGMCGVASHLLCGDDDEETPR